MNDQLGNSEQIRSEGPSYQLFQSDVQHLHPIIKSNGPKLHHMMSSDSMLYIIPPPIIIIIIGGQYHACIVNSVFLIVEWPVNKMATHKLKNRNQVIFSLVPCTIFLLMKVTIMRPIMYGTSKVQFDPSINNLNNFQIL